MALGRLEDPLDGDCVLVEARDAEGALRGFLSFVPWGRNGLSLDLMRRDPTADNGLVELMVTLAGRAARARLGVAPGVAELRDVPRGLRPRRRARGGPDGPAVAAGAAARQPQLAARVALPLQRQVPARVAAALHLLRVRLRPAARRRRRRQRRGLPHRALAQVDPAPSGAAEGGELEHADAGVCRPGPGADPGRPDRLERGADRPASARAGAGSARQGRAGCGQAGVDPYPVGYPRTHTLAEVRAGRRGPAPDTRTGPGRLRRRAGDAQARPRGLGFATLRDGTRRPAGAWSRGRRRRGAAPTLGDTTSTSATTSASPAR